MSPASLAIAARQRRHRLANVGASTSTSFLAVTPAGIVTPLTTAAQNIIAVGFGVSADGSLVYACMRDQCAAIQNQLAPQPLPNK